MKLLRGLLLKPTLNLLSWMLRSNGNSIILGGPLGWEWYSTIDTAHHGALAGPTDAHRHSDLANIGTDDHHARDHATRHQNGGADEISVAGLSGELADPQTPLGHHASHEPGGSDALTGIEIAITWGGDYTEGLSPKATVLFPWSSPAKLSNPATLPAGNGREAIWSPNGEFLAVAHSDDPYVTIYQRSGTTFTKLADPAELPTGTGLGAAWSPNGEFLAIAHTTSPYVTIYQRSGTSFTKLADPATLPTGIGFGATWSPNGEFLAIAHDKSPYVTIYQRSGTTFTKLADPAELPTGTGLGAAWSPNGEFLAIAHTTSPYVTIYQRSGTSFTKLADPATLPGGQGNDTPWSPNGEFLAVAHLYSPYVTIYQTASTLPESGIVSVKGVIREGD